MTEPAAAPTTPKIQVTPIVNGKKNEEIDELKVDDSNNNSINVTPISRKPFRDNLLTAAVAATRKTPSPIAPDIPMAEMHRVVFTGGPCAGKTTTINRMKSFFSTLGWKVLCVPETATILLGTGVYFYELTKESQTAFQENLLKTLLQIEDTVNETAKYFVEKKNVNVMIIYDRGAMDPVSFLSAEEWDALKHKNPEWNEVDLRDNRYDQIIHMVTAANGAEQFYSLDNNCARSESIELAREIDERCSKAWIGHPCMDIVNNDYKFEMKVNKALQVVCERIGLDVKGCFEAGNKKRKFLVKRMPFDDTEFKTQFQELNVVHNYLVSQCGQSRIRKSGQSGNWSYSYAIRRFDEGQKVETRTQIDRKEYNILSKTVDPNHWTIYQKRRCFLWENLYYRVDIYEEPCNPSCRGLTILSTRSAGGDKDLKLPSFIEIEKEVTDDPHYSMYNLSEKCRKK